MPNITTQKTCRQCTQPFTITQEDMAFYDQISPVIGGKKQAITPPTLCYLCRMQRRLSFRSERFLYHRKCSLSGKQIISTYPAEVPWPVYDNDEWWSDKWDAKEYGRDFDFNRPFFEQFFELRDRVPRLALIQQKPMENSQYCNAASRNKNCYLVFSTNRCEDCYYGSWVNNCTNCVDNLNVHNCELCYQCVGCRDCYNVQYSVESDHCNDSFFLKNCSGCSNCFGCSNLVNKQYYIFNKPHTKEEYEDFLKKTDMGDMRVVKEIQRRMEKEFSHTMVKESQKINTENSSGNYLRNCKNCFTCFECDNSEQLRYCFCVDQVKNCMDYSYWGVNAEWVYETQAAGYNINNILFCNLVWDSCHDLLYSDHCRHTDNSFGCVGLKNSSYCIFNKQYTKEEYEDLVPRIIEHMKKTGEWGEFFPIKYSPYGYNETLAHEQLPLTKKQVTENQWKWQDQKEKISPATTPYSIPENIKDVPEEITKNILKSQLSEEPYKIIPPELDFYKRQKVPIPLITPDERHEARLKKRNPRVLYKRQCAKCQTPIETTYAPDRPETVYCEACYLKEVY